MTAYSLGSSWQIDSEKPAIVASQFSHQPDLPKPNLHSLHVVITQHEIYSPTYG